MEVIRLPPMSPNLNAYAERFVRSIKEECLNRMIFVGEASLRRAVSEFVEHYHEERNHQGLDNALIRSAPVAAANNGYLIIDRDTKYTEQFRRLVRESGTEVIRLPPMSPNLNAYAERFVRSIKEECLNRMIFVGQASLRRAVSQFIEHYHEERNHQGLGNRLIRPCSADAANDGSIRRRQRLGGTLNFYHRMAA
jgi:transposase InsO family protein